MCAGWDIVVGGFWDGEVHAAEAIATTADEGGGAGEAATAVEGAGEGREDGAGLAGAGGGETADAAGGVEGCAAGERAGAGAVDGGA